MAQPKKKQSWYLDSECSRHMTGDESLFQELDRNKSENVSFGDNSKGVIQGIGTIGNCRRPILSGLLVSF